MKQRDFCFWPRRSDKASIYPLNRIKQKEKQTTKKTQAKYTETGHWTSGNKQQ